MLKLRFDRYINRSANHIYAKISKKQRHPVKNQNEENTAEVSGLLFTITYLAIIRFPARKFSTKILNFSWRTENSVCMKQRVKVQGKILQKKDVNACKSHINRKLKACRNLFLSGKNSPSTHSSANGQILTRTLERKWLPNDRAIELLIRDWKLGTPKALSIYEKTQKFRW